MSRLALAFIVTLLLVARPQGQAAPTIVWTHSGTTVTHFQVVIGNDGKWVIDVGMPTPVDGVYTYTLPALPPGTYDVTVKACYGAQCSTSAAMKVSKSVVAGAQNLNFYWVDDTGTQTTWDNCKSDTPLAGAAACTYETANLYASAGQTVWYRDGSYVFNGRVTGDNGALVPQYSGNCPSPPCTGGVGANRITFAAFPGETPIFIQTDSSKFPTGLYIGGKSWIHVRGLTFRNFRGTYGYIDKEASYNEIDHCTFDTTDPTYEGKDGGFYIGDYTVPSEATHNYLHDNYFSKQSNSNGPCNEGPDLIRLGESIGGPTFANDNYTSLIGNYAEYSSHSVLNANSIYNVVQNNIFHNEPWIEGCTHWKGTVPNVYGCTVGSTSSTQTTFALGTKTVTTGTGLPTEGLCNYWIQYTPAALSLQSDPTYVMTGYLNSYNPSTGELSMQVNYVTDGAPGGNQGPWWVTAGAMIPEYENAAYNGKFGHRNIGFGDERGAGYAEKVYTVVEGNRIGFASTNPSNGGSSGTDLASQGTIYRHNFLFGNMHSGALFKRSNAYSTPGAGGTYNHVFNNTFYRNGKGWDAMLYGASSQAFNRQGIAQGNSMPATPTYNQIKNNLIYDSGKGDICDLGWYPTTTCSPQTSWDTIENNWLTEGHSNPFVNPDLSDPLSQNFFPSLHGYTTTPIPNLSLAEGTSAIGAGRALTTTTNAAASPSTSLKVADAWYFQDGTWGSLLSHGRRVFPDRLAIGSVSNVVTISAINYATGDVTLATATTWSNGADVWLYSKSDGVRVLYGSNPDAGAAPYGAGTPTAPTAVQIR